MGSLVAPASKRPGLLGGSGGISVNGVPFLAFFLTFDLFFADKVPGCAHNRLGLDLVVVGG